MSVEIDMLIAVVRDQSYLSPVMKQVLINRLEHTPTEAEISYARDQITGRTSAMN